jgi:hypothetical protein
MIRKQFSQQLHDDNDPIARKKVKKFIEWNHGISLMENPDKYDIDLICQENGNITAGYEVERRHNWLGKDFPFATLHVPERKAKYADRAYPTYYVATNKLVNYALLMPFSELQKAYCQEQRNKFVGEGEFFFNVPVDHLTMELICLDAKEYGSD